MRRKIILAIPVIALLFVVWATGDVLAAPPWRGSEGSTFQQWSFSDPNLGYVIPDIGWDNAYGTPFLRVDCNSQWRESYSGHNGIWVLGGLYFIINNYPWLQPEKEIWLELTWRPAGLTFFPDHPIIGIGDDTDPYESKIVKFLEGGMGNGWMYTLFKIYIWPSPTQEWFTVKGDIMVDQIVVDTRYLPLSRHADLDYDGDVDFEDFALFAQEWLNGF